MLKTHHLLTVAAAVLLLNGIQANKKDRYDGFTAKYLEFCAQTSYPVLPEDLLDPSTSTTTSKDVTSCLFGKKKELLKALSAAKQPAIYNNRLSRLAIVDGSDTWLVDYNGVVRHAGQERALSEEAFLNLRMILFSALPYNSGEMLTEDRHGNRLPPPPRR